MVVASISISIGDMKSKDFLMYRCALEMLMTKGDMSVVYQKFEMVLKKNNYYFIYSRNMKSHDMRNGLQVS